MPLILLLGLPILLVWGWTVVSPLSLVASAQLTGEALEQEARVIDAMLIAPCCFSQQVSVHKSPAADEAKADIRARLAAGQTRQQILDAYVEQHGKHVLAEPPAVGFDRVLYVLPFVMLAGSLGLIALVVRRFTGRSTGKAAMAGIPSDAQADSDGLVTQLDDDLRDLD